MRSFTRSLQYMQFRVPANAMAQTHTDIETNRLGADAVKIGNPKQNA